MGMAKTFFDPKRDHVKTLTNRYFYIILGAALNKTFMVKYNGVFLRMP